MFAGDLDSTALAALHLKDLVCGERRPQNLGFSAQPMRAGYMALQPRRYNFAPAQRIIIAAVPHFARVYNLWGSGREIFKVKLNRTYPPSRVQFKRKTCRTQRSMARRVHHTNSKSSLLVPDSVDVQPQWRCTIRVSMS